MRENTIAGLSSSALGFGCASLGSRISATHGLRALAEAHAKGVRWFDLAPAYGAGQAEEIFGSFLKGTDRTQLRLCTKVGLTPPPQNALKKIVRDVARPLVSAAAPLRSIIRKSGATANRRVPLTVDLVRASLEQSLIRLGTDHVDVYALHNARPEDLDRADIMRALEDLRTSGKTRALAVAGDSEVASAVTNRDTPFDIVQLAQPAGATGAALMADIKARSLGCVTHSVFGVAGTLKTLTQRLGTDPALKARLAQAGFEGPAETAGAALLMARAFASNDAGVVLASMFSERSLHRNLEAVEAPLQPAALRLCLEIGI